MVIYYIIGIIVMASCYYREGHLTIGGLISIPFLAWVWPLIAVVAFAVWATEICDRVIWRKNNG